METNEFLSTVLGEKGYYCSLGLSATKDGSKQKFYDSVDSVVETAKNLQREGYDAYFALGTFVAGTQRISENVQQLKSLFLDLDCGANKPYLTQGDAYAALTKFRKHYQLPLPTAVVNSGRGLHIYWVLSTACTKEEWLPVAQALKSACAEFGLEADGAVTSDAARVLRVPGTTNFKGDAPLPVELVRFNDVRVCLDEFAACFPKTAIPVSSIRELSVEDAQDLKHAAGKKYKYQYSFTKLIKATAVGEGCAQIDRAIRTPNELSYDQWLDVLSIPKHCDVDGESFIHALSKGYDGYSEKETDTVAASINYPHRCTTFEGNHPAGCEGCPHKGKPFFKTPLKLCAEVPEATSHIVEPSPLMEQTPEVEVSTPPTVVKDTEPPPTVSKNEAIPPYPFPYFRAENGGVYKKVVGEGNIEEHVEIYHRDLFVSKRLLDPIDGRSFLFEHHTAREGIEKFVLKHDQITGREEFRKALGRHGVFLIQEEVGKVMKYVARWVRHLNDNMDLIDVHAQFGWTKNLKSYVIGDKEIFANRIENSLPSARTAQYIPLFQKKGSLEGWKRIAKFYDRPNFEEHQMMFGLSFGSPLMKFIPGIPGAIFHLMSVETGYGKTTGMKGGASVWGDPNSKLILKGKDTGNSGWHRAEVWKNHVLYIDEISNYMDKDASDFCYAISDGEQKNRMSNKGENTERYRGESWDLMCGTTGNSSIEEKMTKFKSLPQGEMARLIENVVEKLLFTTEEANEANILQDDLSNHYGHAGHIFIQRLLQDMPSAEKLVLNTRDQMLKDAHLESQHRYWVAGTAATFAGLSIAYDLGLIDWDLKALYRWIITKLVSMRLDMKDMVINIDEIIGEFYQDHPQGWLRVKVDPASSDNIQLMHSNTPSYKWVGRHEPESNKLFIFPNQLKLWCIKKGHYYKAIRHLMIEQMQGKAYRMRAGRGTQYDVGTPHVIECSWNYDAHIATKQESADLIGEVDDDASNVH